MPSSQCGVSRFSTPPPVAVRIEPAAGDHQDRAPSLRLVRGQEAAEIAPGPLRGHAMQVDARLDLLPTSLEARMGRAVERPGVRSTAGPGPGRPQRRRLVWIDARPARRRTRLRRLGGAARQLLPARERRGVGDGPTEEVGLVVRGAGAGPSGRPPAHRPRSARVLGSRACAKPRQSSSGPRISLSGSPLSRSDSAPIAQSRSKPERPESA